MKCFIFNGNHSIRDCLCYCDTCLKTNPLVQDPNQPDLKHTSSQGNPEQRDK